MVFLGGMRGFIRGVCGFIWGAVHSFIWGACVVLFRGHAWFYSLGMRGFIQGGMHSFYGGHAWFFQFFRIQWDTVNERAVRILLECILVVSCTQCILIYELFVTVLTLRMNLTADWSTCSREYCRLNVEPITTISVIVRLSAVPLPDVCRFRLKYEQQFTFK